MTHRHWTDDGRPSEGMRMGCLVVAGFYLLIVAAALWWWLTRP